MLAKRVCADTITKITSAPDFAAQAFVPPAPSAQDLIALLRKNFSDAEDAALRALAAEPKNQQRQSEQKRVADLRASFEDILKNVPDGFALVPVYYSYIGQKKNEKLQSQYLSSLRRDFLRFLGDNHADDLRKLGVCEHGIVRMQRGLDAANAQGELYYLNIDHIVERSGSGLWADKATRAQDPDNPGAGEIYRVNHFGNFILLPNAVHDFKNALNSLQQATALKEGEGKWILMLTPRRDARLSGFVCPPQPPGHPLHGLRKRGGDMRDRLGHVSFVAWQANDCLRKVLSHPLVAANDNKPLGNRKLRRIFNDMSKDPSTKREIDSLRPHLEETATLIPGIFSEVAARRGTNGGRKVFENFISFFHGRNLRRLRERSARLPFAEAAALQAAVSAIDGKMSKIRRREKHWDIPTVQKQAPAVPPPASQKQRQKPRKPRAPQYGLRRKHR